ncbi:lipopolysaccharide heptosyltransferase I [Nitrospirota bacterium]
MHLKDTSRILIVKPSSLGDVVHALPVLAALKKHYPASSIDWVVADELSGLIDGHPLLDRIWIIKKSRWKDLSRIGKTLTELSKLRSELKGRNYDLVLDLQGLLRSGIISRFTGSPIRIGFKEAREGSTLFYTHKVEGGTDIHAVDRYIKIAAEAGCDTSEVEFPVFQEPFDIPFDKKEYAVLVPGARWETKVWPAENFGRLASMLPVPSFIVGGPGDEKKAERLMANSEGKATSLVGKTSLKQLAHVISNAKYMITNDSGPMHIAAALRVPVFAIFGPTSAARTGPYGEGHTIITSETSCAPCFSRTCNKGLECMLDVTSEDVFSHIEKHTF